MRVWRIFLVFCFLALASKGYAQKVKVEYDRNVDFTSFKTYAWMRGTPAPDPRMDQFVRETIEGWMAAKGLQKQDQGQPDLNVVYYVVPGDAKMGVVSLAYGWPEVVTNSPIPAPTRGVQVFLERSLVLDMLNAKTKSLVWRAVGTAVVESNIGKMAKKVEKGAEKMFKKFPPKKK